MKQVPISLVWSLTNWPFLNTRIVEIGTGRGKPIHLVFDISLSKNTVHYWRIVKDHKQTLLPNLVWNFRTQ